jgi:crotonobetainyl-CoA:carnitine CoA-transferase CaiB-like acyl-CoA transferase
MNVVTIAQNVPGPVAVARLVRRGARAIKIEPPAGDQLATLCPAWYAELHHGVDVHRLDLKSADGMRALREMLAACDVFVASQRPAALERLRLDASTLAREFPNVRHLNIVGDTAHPEHAGHDLTYLAQHGLLHDTMPLTLIADMVGAERTYTAAIELMQQPGGASRVVGLADAIHDLAAPLRHGLTAPGGPLGGGNPAYAIYAARDGRIAVAALEPHFRARFYELLELRDGADPTAVLSTKSAAEWEQWARTHDLPIAAIHDRGGKG